MSFYYGPPEPPDEEKPAGFRETMTIIWVAFSVLAVPLALILGVFFGIVLIIWLFLFSRLLGALTIVVILGAVAGYGVWEAKHPPKLG
ncbi:MAG: hypothetical protein HUU14_00610 [Dehalococcoidia bacterium]|nr:MAG: hypothetical protein EDM76_08200 [bacterium]MCE7927442.1 hypothetical protein [Chloroflexi bacterium CFX7]MCK6564136.1 hypothetical protein [Dehalococcoidia bacterium]MCL4231293.1 hypothetical protein [Dehalococcoidia bacterium]NUQ54370.1 hypothetical protein [Dehalococcoidia bacterium]